MRSLIFLTVVLFLASCSNNGGNALSSSDSLVVQFKSIESGGVVKTVATTDKTAIKKMADFTDGEASTQYKCGYDGNLLFYTKGKLTSNVSFNYSQEGCRHFLQKQGDTLKATTMKNEAADFLKGLAEGKSWY